MLSLPSELPVHLKRVNSWVLPRQALGPVLISSWRGSDQKGSFRAPLRPSQWSRCWEVSTARAFLLIGPAAGGRGGAALSLLPARLTHSVHASFIGQLSGASSRSLLGARLSSEEELKCPSVPGSEQFAPVPHLWAGYSEEFRSLLLGAGSSPWAVVPALLLTPGSASGRRCRLWEPQAPPLWNGNSGRALPTSQSWGSRP